MTNYLYRSLVKPGMTVVTIFVLILSAGFFLPADTKAVDDCDLRGGKITGNDGIYTAPDGTRYNCSCKAYFKSVPVDGYPPNSDFDVVIQSPKDGAFWGKAVRIFIDGREHGRSVINLDGRSGADGSEHRNTFLRVVPEDRLNTGAAGSTHTIKVVGSGSGSADDDKNSSGGFRCGNPDENPLNNSWEWNFTTGSAATVPSAGTEFLIYPGIVNNNLYKPNPIPTEFSEGCGNAGLADIIEGNRFRMSASCGYSGTSWYNDQHANTGDWSGQTFKISEAKGGALKGFSGKVKITKAIFRWVKVGTATSNEGGNIIVRLYKTDGGSNLRQTLLSSGNATVRSGGVGAEITVNFPDAALVDSSDTLYLEIAQVDKLDKELWVPLRKSVSLYRDDYEAIGQAYLFGGALSSMMVSGAPQGNTIETSLDKESDLAHLEIYGQVASGNDAICKAFTPPGELVGDEYQAEERKSYLVSVTMTNTGTATWSNESSYRLGSQDPQDDPAYWGMNRISVPENITSGTDAVYSFVVNTPDTRRDPYNFSWKMVQDGVEWFGAKCGPVPIHIKSRTTRASPSPAPGSLSAPVVTIPGCFNSSGNYYVGADASISWSDPGIEKIDISASSPLSAPIYSKTVSGLSLTSLIRNSSGQADGFLNAGTLFNPRQDTTYYVASFKSGTGAGAGYSPLASFKIPKCVTLFGQVLNAITNAGISGIIINQSASGPGCSSAPLPRKTTYADGSFIYPDIAPGRLFCLQAPVLGGYSGPAVYNPYTGAVSSSLSSYNCQIAGGRAAADSCGNTIASGSNFDMDSDYNYNFYYTPLATNPPISCAFEDCPADCHIYTEYAQDGTYNPDGSCKKRECLPNPSPAGTCPTSCTTTQVFVDDGSCGTLSCEPCRGICVDGECSIPAVNYVTPWIWSSGDVHSNDRISAPGKP